MSPVELLRSQVSSNLIEIHTNGSGCHVGCVISAQTLILKKPEFETYAGTERERKRAISKERDRKMRWPSGYQEIQKDLKSVKV